MSKPLPLFNTIDLSDVKLRKIETNFICGDPVKKDEYKFIIKGGKLLFIPIEKYQRALNSLNEIKSLSIDEIILSGKIVEFDNRSLFENLVFFNEKERNYFVEFYKDTFFIFNNLQYRVSKHKEDRYVEFIIV